MSQLTAVDISDSDRFELADVLKEESESSSAPRALEDILQETCDDDFDPMSQRSCYELLAAYVLHAVPFSASNRSQTCISIKKEASEWIRDLNAQSLPNAR